MAQLWSVETCERESASLLLWRGVEGQSTITAAPFRCHSWRCKRCAWQVAREDFRRVESAATSRDWWLYGVLTFDPRDFDSRIAAYQEAGTCWDRKLRRTLEKHYGKTEYLQTWERHRSGWPHVNILFRSHDLQKWIEHAGTERRPVVKARRPRQSIFTRWRRQFRKHAIDAGFGRSVWLEVVQDRVGMSHYLVKVAQEFTSSSAKDGDQTPLEAPAHFRRLRASKGLLPPRVRVRWVRHVDERTSEVSWSLAEKELDAGKAAQAIGESDELYAKRLAALERESWTGVLSPIPLGEFTTRKPGWVDVANAWEFQENATRARRRKKAHADSLALANAL